MEEDRDLDPLIDPGLLLRAATRRTEVRTAARVGARRAAPRDADAVGIANVCVAVGWVRRARWGAIPIADDELSKAEKILRLTPTLGRIRNSFMTGKWVVNASYLVLVRHTGKQLGIHKNQIAVHTMFVPRNIKMRKPPVATHTRTCSQFDFRNGGRRRRRRGDPVRGASRLTFPPFPPIDPGRALPFFAPVKVQTRFASMPNRP